MKKPETSPQFSLEQLIAYMQQYNTFAYETGAEQQRLARKQADYARKHGLYQDLVRAQEEGVYEVSLKSETKAVTLRITPGSTGVAIVDELCTEVGEELRQLNKDILAGLLDLHNITSRGHNDGKGEDAAIHALCMPQAVGRPTAPVLVSGDRCPFLPAK